MFYCESCRKEKKWPQSMSLSTGACELCKEIGTCYDIPSKYLPEPKTQKPCSMEEFNRKWQKAIDDRAKRIKLCKWLTKTYKELIDNHKMCNHNKRVMIKPNPPPRYDDVYFDGVAWLDKQ